MKRAPAWDFPFAGSWWRSMAAGFGSKARRERAAPSALACHFLHRKELVERQLQYGKGPVARCFSKVLLQLGRLALLNHHLLKKRVERSEERRVGKESRSGW